MHPAAPTSIPKQSKARRYRHSSPRCRCFFNWQQPTLTLSHSVSLPKLARLAWQLGSCQCWLSNGDEQECAMTAKHNTVCRLARSPALVEQSPTSLLLPQFGLLPKIVHHCRLPAQFALISTCDTTPCNHLVRKIMIMIRWYCRCWTKKRGHITARKGGKRCKV